MRRPLLTRFNGRRGNLRASIAIYLENKQEIHKYAPPESIYRRCPPKIPRKSINPNSHSRSSDSNKQHAIVDQRRRARMFDRISGVFTDRAAPNRLKTTRQTNTWRTSCCRTHELQLKIRKQIKCSSTHQHSSTLINKMNLHINSHQPITHTSTSTIIITSTQSTPQHINTIQEKHINTSAHQYSHQSLTVIN